MHRRLRSSQDNDVILYVTGALATRGRQEETLTPRMCSPGHSGDGFLKFQDSRVLTSRQLADGLAQLARRRGYRRLLLLLDTCHATTLLDASTALLPNFTALVSSRADEEATATQIEQALGVYHVDEFTRLLLSFLERTRDSPEARRVSLRDLVRGGKQIRVISHKLARPRRNSTPTCANFKSIPPRS
jgi:glycosylphosphatidylinositol transamidase (GPIT) subunit GPI8